MISLLTSPDITYTGFKVTVIGLDSEVQEKVTALLNEVEIDGNIALYDISPQTNNVEYVLAVLETSNLIIFNNPNLFHWLTGYILSLPNCYYMEYDSASLNTLYKLSLRHIVEENINLLVNNAIQKKYGKAL